MVAEPRTVTYDPNTTELGLNPKRAEADVQLDRHIRRITFYVVMLVLGIAGLGAAYLAFVIPDDPANVATKEWARAVLTTIIGGVVGMAFAKK